MPRVRRSGLLGAGLLALLGAGLLVWWGGAFSGSEDAALPADGPPRDGGTGRGSPPGGLLGAEAAPAARPPEPAAAPAGELAALETELVSLRASLARGAEARTEAERAAHKRLLRSLRERARHVEGAHVLLSALATEQDAATALRLGRALRNAQHAEIAGALARLAVDGAASPLARRGAVVALEMRPPEIWYEPVKRAYETDPDPRVRLQAANLLGRALLDRLQAARHDDVRRVLRAGLASDDADQRLRTLTAMMADPGPGAEDVDAVRARLQDGDERVRREAAATLRVFEQRRAR